MKKIIISISCMSIIFLTFSGIVFPWEIDNHEKISEKALNISQLPQYLENNLGYSFLFKQFSGATHSKDKWDINEFVGDMDYTVTEWIKHGSGAEDEFFEFIHLLHYGKNMRPVNHFYNPFWDNLDIYPYPNDGWGNDWLSQEGGLYDDIVTGIAGVDLYVGKPSLRWGYDGCPDSPPNSYFSRSENNYFSWIMSKKYFYAALTGDSTEIDGIGSVVGKVNMNKKERDRCFALLFRSLGQLMHLIQDSGQPEHTRNDAHPLSGKIGFEKHAIIYNCTSFSCSSIIPWQAIVKSDNPFFDFFDSNRSGGGYGSAISTGLAEFSNYNFLTKDSIVDNLMYDHCEPNCEPSGHERHRFFTSPRINEGQVIQEAGFLYDTYYYVSEDIIDPIGMTTIPAYKLAKRRWYHNLLLLYGWNDYTTEDPKIWDDYLDILIPKCIGYSAALLDYFFRGAIEITLPDSGAYALTDKDPSITDPSDPRYIENPASQGFDRIQLLAQNTAPESEEMTGGTVTLVVKYKLGQGDQFQNPPAATSDEFYYIVKELEGTHSIPRNTPALFEFNINDSQIPLWATDIYINLVYKGTLGSEEGAIAVGFKDISEPTPINYYNVMDKICMNEQLFDSGSTAAIAHVDTDSNGVADPDEWDVYPHNAENIHIRFSPEGNPQAATSASSADNSYEKAILVPDDYFRLFILSDHRFNRSASVEYVKITAEDQCDQFHGIFPRPARAMNAIKNQTDLVDPVYCGYEPCYARLITGFHTTRGVVSYFSVLFDNASNPIDSICSYED